MCHSETERKYLIFTQHVYLHEQISYRWPLTQTSTCSLVPARTESHFKIIYTDLFGTVEFKLERVKCI